MLRRCSLCWSVIGNLAAVLALTATASAQLTAFTYQGRLKSGASPANGQFDFQFALWNAAIGGAQQGGTLIFDGVGADPPPLTVTGGLFTVQLDFGAQFPGAARYLEIAVRPHAVGAYTTLSPRQQLTPTPYAIFAEAPWVTAGANIFYTGGNVGMGDAAPATALSVGSGGKFRVGGGQGDVTFTDDQASITFPATAGANAPMIQMFASGTANADRMVIAHSAAFPNWGLQYQDSVDHFNFLGNGNPALTVDLSSLRVGVGVLSPSFKLDVGDRMRLRQGGSSSAGFWLYQTVPAADRAFVGMYDDNTFGLWGNTGAGWNFFMNTTTGNIGINTATPARPLDVNGTARVSVLEITGADLAERFEFSETVEPGMVVAIDPQNPGKLCVARGTYNRCVAGIVSGANDLHAGVVLAQDAEAHNTGQHAVALNGRVWVYGDATAHAIVPGDLLTTAERPGYAMVVTERDRADGAILGKAMSGLKQGETGLVLVLVNLR